jgi:hypothetical protein
VPEDLKRFSSVAHADVHLINRLQEYLLARDPKAQLLAVTPMYSGQMAGWEDFNKALGSLLRKDVDVLWTGPKIFSTWSIKATDLAAINVALGRKVTIWDNSPPWPGSIVGRGQDLPNATNGFLSNNMLAQGGYPMSFFWRAMGPIADYTWNADAYDPARSIEVWRNLGH